jgi:hypothetical protein
MYILIILLAVTEVGFVNINMVSAQVERGTVPPDAFTKPPKITIYSPINGTIYANGTLTLNINVTLPQSSTASGTILYYVAYTTSWNGNETVYLYTNKGLSNSIEWQIHSTGHQQYFMGSIEVPNIPDGNHNITIIAYAGGFYPADAFSAGDGLGFYRFLINGVATVFFTVGNQATPAPSPSSTVNNPSNSLSIDYLLPISFISTLTIGTLILLYRRYRKTANLKR